MPICLKCYKDFSNEFVLNGIKRNTRIRKACFECKPFKPKKLCLPESQKNIECAGCSRIYDYSGRKGHTLEVCNSCRTNRNRFEVNRRCIDYKGGKCIECGYNKTMGALSFHHRNPKTKKFNVAGSHTKSWEVLKRELDKCDLLCMNCHIEKHSLL